MAEDDDKTPRHRRARSHWGDEERAAVGRERRNAPPRGVPIRDQVDELAEALPLEAPPEQDDTAPYDGDLSAEAAWLSNRLDRTNARIQRARQDSADKVLEALGKVPPSERCAGLEKRQTRTETRLKFLIAILAAIGIAVLGMAVAVVKGVYARGQVDGQVDARLNQVERSVQHAADRIDQLEGLLSSGAEGRRPFHLLSPPPVPLQPKEASP